MARDRLVVSADGFVPSQVAVDANGTAVAVLDTRGRLALIHLVEHAAATPTSVRHLPRWLNQSGGSTAQPTAADSSDEEEDTEEEDDDDDTPRSPADTSGHTRGHTSAALASTPAVAFTSFLTPSAATAPKAGTATSTPALSARAAKAAYWNSLGPTARLVQPFAMGAKPWVAQSRRQASNRVASTSMASAGRVGGPAMCSAKLVAGRSVSSG